MPRRRFSNITLGYIYGAIGVVIFGLTLPMTSIAVAELPALFVGLGRSVAAAGIAIIYLISINAKKPTPKQFKQIVFVPIGVVFGFPALTAIAMKTAPASHGGVVLGILPLATAIAAMFVAGERASKSFWLWGVIGACAVISFSLLEGGAEIYNADLLLLGAVCLAAFGYAVSGDLARSMGALEVISWALIISLPVLVIVTWFSLENFNGQVSWKAWAAFGYVAIFSQFLGFAFWNKGLALGGISHVGQVQLIQVFVTLLASFFILGEIIKPTTIIFATIVVVAIFMGRKAQVTRPARSPRK